MMLSVEYPQIHAYISTQFHGGLYPLKFVKDLRIRLIVKASKERILAAKINKGFKIYVAPIEDTGLRTFALISAFYDTESDPLTITTPLFSSMDSEHHKEMLLSKGVDIHFFDENNIEYLAYKATIDCPENTRSLIANSEFLPFTSDRAKRVIDQMENWYIHRSREDDYNAISISLTEPLFPDDFIILDARPTSSTIMGGRGVPHTTLEREEPGELQERDIANLLRRIFMDHQIYLNPLQFENREEISDVMVVGENHILLIQAKDSPNLEKILRKNVQKKKSTTLKHLEKALRQVKGAIKYTTKSERMRFIVGKRSCSLRTANQNIFSLIVVRELFLDDYEAYTKMTLEVTDELQYPCILLEYNELHTYTMNLTTEDAFFDACKTVFSKGKEHNIFPRLRFGFK